MSETPPPMFKSARPLTLAHVWPIGKITKFWDGLKEGKLFTTKCKKCGKLNFPPAADCVQCLSSDMEWVELSGEAELETYTQVVIQPATFAQYEPYIVAIGKLKEGVKALAWLTSIKREDVKIGMKLKVRAKVTPEGRATYEFVPA